MKHDSEIMYNNTMQIVVYYNTNIRLEFMLNINLGKC